MPSRRSSVRLSGQETSSNSAQVLHFRTQAEADSHALQRQIDSLKQSRLTRSGTRKLDTTEQILGAQNAPVYTLSDDILEYLFELGSDDQSFVELTCQVVSRWRRVALGLPRPWKRIRLDVAPKTSGPLSRLKKLAERASTCLLDLKIRIDPANPSDKRFAADLVDYASKTLIPRCTSFVVINVSVYKPALGSFPSDGSNLQHLHLDYLSIRDSDSFWAAIATCHQLRELSIPGDIQDMPAKPITLASVRKLALISGYFWRPSTFLKYLRCPVLETLEIPGRDTWLKSGMINLSRTLEHDIADLSTPELWEAWKSLVLLRTLRLVDVWESLHTRSLVLFLCHLPSLEHLVFSRITFDEHTSVSPRVVGPPMRPQWAPSAATFSFDHCVDYIALLECFHSMLGDQNNSRVGLVRIRSARSVSEHEREKLDGACLRWEAVMADPGDLDED